MNIPSSELRLNNIFFNAQTGALVKVAAIEDNALAFEIDPAASGELCPEPLPCTNELLGKLGFRPEYTGWRHEKMPALYLRKYANTVIYKVRTINNIVVAEFHYLHELQNIFFALTKEELNINTLSFGQPAASQN